MGRHRIQIDRRADRQIENALTRWANHRPAAPDLLDRELARALVLISNFSHIAPRTLTEAQEIRRKLLSRTQYLLEYRVGLDGVITIVRFVHAARRR